MRMVVTDLDGTLLPVGGTFPVENLSALRRLGDEGVLRVVATGRTLHGARRSIPPDLPIDYLIFSSGAGVLEWPTQEILVRHHLSSRQVSEGRRVLDRHSTDYMVHAPIPDNHFFYSVKTGSSNPDFDERCRRQAAFCEAASPSAFNGEATQFVVVARDAQKADLLETVRADLPGFNVIRVTSPLDGVSLWLEIFSPDVSKGLAAEWLARRRGISREQTLAVGNDYNDLDLLDWAGSSFVVANSPPDLLAKYATVASDRELGFSEAIHKTFSFTR